LEQNGKRGCVKWTYYILENWAGKVPARGRGLASQRADGVLTLSGTANQTYILENWAGKRPARVWAWLPRGQMGY